MKFHKGSVATAVAAAGLAVFLLAPSRAQPAASGPDQASRSVAAPGLVEPYGQERQIASQVIGVIDKMLVDENDPVAAGQAIAIVENSEQAARLAEARANLAEAQAQLDKTVNGPRLEERREGVANLAEMDADMELANLQFARKQPLVERGVASREALDQAAANMRAMKARRAAMSEKLALINTGSRAEDIAIAQASFARAKAEAALAEAQLDKFIIRSPIAGVILRRQRNAGEAVTNVDPTPIAIVGDLSRLRVRAEVDETDIGEIAVGQRVQVAADAFPGRKSGGAVARIAQRLGAKEVQTGRPAEKVDMKVLQVLVDLDPEVKLPVGLRVDVTFSGATAQR